MGWQVHSAHSIGDGPAVIFEGSDLPGVVVISPDRHTDFRGFFARTWCAREFADAGLPSSLAQCSVSWNERMYTLRGLHWEVPPHNESKLVRCTRGAIFDVVVDLRPASSGFLRHIAIELDADDHRAVFIPPGCAHGFLTLADRSEVMYQMDTFYAPQAERGARWDDPAFAIEWPAAPLVISDRDRSFTSFASDQAVLARTRP